jgi:uncharacterized protein with von Willebrand factor type A (vWA) domain
MINGPLFYNLPKKAAPAGLASEIIRFAGFLKKQGFKVSLSNVHDSICSVLEIDPADKDVFQTTLRANLVKNELEWNRFPDLFNEFWAPTDEFEPALPGEDGRPDQKGPDADPSCEDLSKAISALSMLECEPDPGNAALQTAYSSLPAMVEKDFACLDRSDIPAVQQIIQRMLRPFKIHRSRRLKRSKKPWRIDFRRVLRKSLKTEGLPLKLFFKGKKKKLRHLVFLIDVSGSMDRYARLVLPFLLSLRKVGAKADVFVFSTSMVSITLLVRHMGVDQIFDNLARFVPDWSGGTRIGYSLHRFNRNQGARLRSHRSVVVILSDGWDLGERRLLEQEMQTLNRNAHTIIWLNPLAGDPDYQPLCQGMKTALPYVDYFLPAENINSLEKAARLIERLAFP